MTLCKTNIERSFSRAAHTYDEAIQFQKPCAEDFAAWLAVRSACRPKFILETGCGTGLLTARLHTMFPSARILATDLSSGMIRFCTERYAGTPIRFQVHDFDLPFAVSEIDLAVSSLSLQWSRNLRTAFENVYRVLRPGAEFFASIPLEASLSRIRELFYEEGAAFRGPVLPSLSQIEYSLNGLFRNLSMETHRYSENYPDFRSFLRSMRRNGTSGGNRETPVPVLKKMIRNHQSPCSADYEIVFLKGIRA